MIFLRNLLTSQFMSKSSSQMNENIGNFIFPRPQPVENISPQVFIYLYVLDRVSLQELYLSSLYRPVFRKSIEPVKVWGKTLRAWKSLGILLKSQK